LEAILGKQRMAFVFIYKGGFHEKEIPKFGYHYRTQDDRSQGALEG
jgi:hypothetical protein